MSQTDSPSEAAKVDASRPRRIAREDYLSDFDEMLTELDLYKQKQQSADESPSAAETNASPQVAEEQEEQEQ